MLGRVRSEPRGVVLALMPMQAKRPSAAGLLAAMLAVRLRSSGIELVVIADAELRDDLVEIIGKATNLTIDPQTWLQRTGAPTDPHRQTDATSGLAAEELGVVTNRGQQRRL